MKKNFTQQKKVSSDTFFLNRIDYSENRILSKTYSTQKNNGNKQKKCTKNNACYNSYKGIANSIISHNIQPKFC